MASQSEKTHAKNIENVFIAMNIAGSISNFDPNNPLITLTELEAFKTGSESLMEAVNAVLPAEQNAVGEQIAAFKQVSGRVTKIMKAVRGQNLSEEFVGHLTTTANRLRGISITPETPDNPETPEDESKSDNSSSRRSYAGILESLDLFDEQLKSNSAYKPNEDEYKTAAITAWIAELRTKHTAALAAKAVTTNARAARDQFIYNPTSGLLVRMKALKNYVESILDKSDPRLKQLKKLRFVDFSK